MKTTGIILAGGRSSRFGQDKTQYLIQGKTMTERAADFIRPFVDEILISVDREGKFNLPGTREVVDIYAETGPIGGIYTGLSEAETESCFVIAADMPKIDIKLTNKLFELSENYKVVIPERKGRLEPLCGIYKKAVLPELEAEILAGEYALCSFLAKQKEKGGVYFYSLQGKEENFLYNVNFLEDIQKLWTR